MPQNETNPLPDYLTTDPRLDPTRKKVLGVFRGEKPQYEPTTIEGKPAHLFPPKPDTVEAAFKGMLSELTFGAYSPDAVGTEEEKFAEWGGRAISLLIPVGLTIKAVRAAGLAPRLAKSIGKPIVNKLQEELVEVAIAASLYRASRGAAEGDNPVETLRDIPYEITKWLAFTGVFKGLHKLGVGLKNWWTGEGATLIREESKVANATAEEWSDAARWMFNQTEGAVPPAGVRMDLVEAIQEMPKKVRGKLIREAFRGSVDTKPERVSPKRIVPEKQQALPFKPAKADAPQYKAPSKKAESTQDVVGGLMKKEAKKIGLGEEIPEDASLMVVRKIENAVTRNWNPAAAGPAGSQIRFAFHSVDNPTSSWMDYWNGEMEASPKEAAALWQMWKIVHPEGQKAAYSDKGLQEMDKWAAGLLKKRDILGLDERGVINIGLLKKFFKGKKTDLETKRVNSKGATVWESTSPESTRAATMHARSEEVNKKLRDEKANRTIKREYVQRLFTGQQDPIISRFNQFTDPEASIAKALFVNIRGATPSGQYKAEQIDKALFSGISKGDMEELARIIESRRTIQIDKNVEKKRAAEVAKEVAPKKGEQISFLPKSVQAGLTEAGAPFQMRHPEGLSGYEHQKFLDDYAQEAKNHYFPVADKFFKAQQEMLRFAEAEGLISAAELERLVAAGDYSLRRFLKHVDPIENYYFEGGKKVSVGHSGFKSLQEGDIGNVVEVDGKRYVAVRPHNGSPETRPGTGEKSSLFWSELGENEFPDISGGDWTTGKKFDTGHLEKDPRAHTAYKIMSLENAAFRNRAAKGLWDFVDKHPESGIARKAKAVGISRKGNLVYEDTPAGHTIVNYMDKGVPKRMFMPDEIAADWHTSDPVMNSTVLEAVRWFSGANFVRTFATGAGNPFYALVGFPMDITHTFISSNVYSSILPKYIAQIGKDIGEVWGDVMKQKGIFKEWLENGGMMNFLFQQGKQHLPGMSAESVRNIEKLQEFMVTPNAMSEILVRVALYNRAKKEGYSIPEAVYESRKRMDFADGGMITRAVDNAMPYVNAGAVAFKGTARAAKEKPGVFAWKMAQIATAATLLYYTNKATNPEGYEQVRKPDRENNFIFMLPENVKYVDAKGETHYFYLKLRKDPIGRGWATLWENTAAVAIGEEFDAKSVRRGMLGTLPWQPLQSAVPTLSAIQGYATNKRLFDESRDIWTGPEVKPEDEFLPTKTHPALIEWGQKTGMSPERTKFMLQQYFGYSSPYTAVAGGLLKEMMPHIDDPEKDDIWFRMLRLPGVRSIVGITGTGVTVHDAIKESKQEVGSRRKKIYDQVDLLGKMVLTGNSNVSEADVERMLDKLPDSYKESAWKRWISWKHNARKFADTPIGRTGWFRLLGQDARTRARAFVKEHRRVRTTYGQAEANKMIDIARETAGFWTETFHTELMKIAEEGKEKK